MKSKILNMIIDNNFVTEKEIARNLNVTERTIRRYIKKLKEDNVISLKRSGNKRVWLLK